MRKAQHNSAVKAFGNNKKPVSGSFFLLTGFFIHSFAPAELPLLFLIPIPARRVVASHILLLLSKFENGERIPPTETLIRLADFYDVGID